ncbi:dUTP diphosphatase [Texcoconibacillus texcoconensis]|uniref:Dimeric dUTPase (All-alpha-NTP-PPase superfamily) n=1 Tax=Texcoconibacillus texcoconensis TaxID=1095777 RepID=A0A840QMT8_9BACI|nr:dUTP diphosphatase [Texcoconibacillus texcoconensis]MBB5172695.1 dimeric dUTPase (all-alpha-NTP-PPase superfamily) [Texcoconibacillus texcoconensis]
MNIETLFNMQRALDKHIEEQHELTNEDLFEKRILAFQVELGELANETRCFKFWSTKPSADASVIEEEYVDGLHFLLSLGIVLNAENEVSAMLDEKEEAESVTTQVDAFLDVFDSLSLLRKKRGSSEYQTLFVQFLKLGQVLGITKQNMIDAYIKKNEVNYQRQREGY